MLARTLLVAALAACTEPPASDADAPSLHDDTLAVLRVAYEDAVCWPGGHDELIRPLVTVETPDDWQGTAARRITEIHVDGWPFARSFVDAFVANLAVERHAPTTVEAWDDVTWLDSATLAAWRASSRSLTALEPLDPASLGAFTSLGVPTFTADRRLAVLLEVTAPTGPGTLLVAERTSDGWRIAETHGAWD